MLEAKDPGIKLFGRTIQLPEISVQAGLSDTGLNGSFLSVNSSGDDTPMKEQSCSLDPFPDERYLNEDGAKQESKDALGGSNDDNTEENGGELGMFNKLTEPIDDVAASSLAEEGHSEGSDLQDQTLKKPDKILPCPRCNSMDTKFCYYNNYNVNQPRHYCKNCQRYWTAGGSMKNMAIGAGRWKNKNLASLCRQTRADQPNGIHHPTLKSDCAVNLNLGSDTPLRQSMASKLNIADKRVDKRVDISEEMVPNGHGNPPVLACFSGSPWPCPWNFVQWTSPASPVVYRPSGFRMPFYTAPPFGACAVPCVWSIPPCVTPLIPGHDSPTLGKHPRDDTTSDSEKEQPQKESNPGKCFWVPKTLRIDDPSEAARSFIWTTLGDENDKKAGSVGKSGGPLNAFEPKGRMNNVSTAASVLHANPAALSRALRFHESS